jgi:microcystin-dependent protein
MALPFFNWSRTASSNATADSTVNWAEGQAPSTVNDSARAMMASTAAFRDDSAGAITTSGTSTAYTVTSFQVFDTLAHLHGQVIAFVPHTTSGATVSLSVDGLTAKPLRFAPSLELPAGTLVQGTPYICTYNNSDGVFYLRNYFGNNPFYIPIGGGLDWWGSAVPNSNFAFPTGQAISRSTYATLFGIMGTTYGVGDGSTTFALPDKTGRVSAMKEGSASRLTSTYFGGNSTTLGAVGGAEKETLTSSNIPTLSSSGSCSVSSITVTSTVNTVMTSSATNGFASGVGYAFSTGSITSTGSGSGTASVTYTNGSPTAVVTCQPTIVCNYIIRIA